MPSHLAWERLPGKGTRGCTTPATRYLTPNTSHDNSDARAYDAKLAARIDQIDRIVQSVGVQINRSAIESDGVFPCHLPTLAS